MSVTLIRIPRMQGRPPHWFGLIVIRSSKSAVGVMLGSIALAMPKPLKHKRKGPKSKSLGPITLQVETFAPEPYKAKRPIPISLKRRADGYVASVVEVNVNSSGGTQQEAVANIKELILDVFDSLSSLPPSKLGPGPARPRAVLREFIDGAADHERAREQDREEAEGEGHPVP